jgi:hypothetical protein
MHLGRKEREDLSHIHHFPLFLLQNHFVMQPREQVFLPSSVWIIQVQKPLKLNHVVEKMNQIFNFLIILKELQKLHGHSKDGTLIANVMSRILL